MSLNPYDPIVTALTTAVDACREALVHNAHIPNAKGGGEVQSPTELARNYLDEAVATATMWRDAFDYHVEGNRTDF